MEQAALKVAALLREFTYYILVLDISKSNDMVLNGFLIEKLKKKYPSTW